MRRGLTSTVVVATLTVMAALLLLAWSAGSGTQLIDYPQGTWGPPPITLPEAETGVQTQAPQTEMADDRPAEGEDLNQWIVDAIQIFVALTLLAALVHLARQLMDTRVDDRVTPTQDEDELVALLDATNEEVRYRALSEGDPRNAVVACWVALEEAVASSGLRQDRAETAAELTRRVLSRWEVDESAITALSGAYREARFSRHPITEDQRQSAVDALERIHEDLSRRVAAEQEAREEQRAAEQARAAEAEAEQQRRDAERETAPRRGRRGRR